MRGFNGIRYQDYSAHFPCGMPQSICPAGDPSKVGSRSKEAQQQYQQYRETLLPIVAMMLFSERTNMEIRAVWDRRLESKGVHSEDEEQVKQYFRRIAVRIASQQSQIV